MSVCPHGKETGRCIEICDKPRAQQATPGRVIQVHVADEWAVGIVLARKLEALGGKPGFIARVFDPSPDITAQDFNSMFADEHVGKTWRFPPRDS